MATASDLKEKVTKILSIVEGVDNEHVNLIEKDILLQEVRELYSEILLMKTEGSASSEPIAEEKKEVVDETPVKVEEETTEPPVIAIPFDDADFDFHDILDVNHSHEESETSKEPEPVVDESVAENVEEPVEEIVEDQPEEEPVVAEDQEIETEPEEDLSDAGIEEPEEEIEEEDVSQAEDGYFEQSSASSEFDEEEPMSDDVVEDEPIEVAEEQSEIEPEPEYVEPDDVDNEPAEEVEEVVAEQEQEVVHEEAPVETPAIESPATSTVVEPIHHDPEPEKVITLGEQLGQSRQESLNDKFASNKPAEGSFGLKPISDIKSAIPLGERFRFTRMLFSGNGPAFDSTVAALNGMSSIEEADSYLRTNFRWDMDSPVVVDFMNIVRRRYL